MRRPKIPRDRKQSHQQLVDADAELRDSDIRRRRRRRCCGISAVVLCGVRPPGRRPPVALIHIYN